ncbi:MAG: metallophosphoesterase [Firmicutes bacterium]|nr:metallophosphoesterase [Bacillota bacterium]
MAVFLIMAAAAALLAGAYIFVLFSRALETAGMERKKKRRVISLILTLAVFACVYLFAGYAVMAIYEVFLASALLEILNIFLKRTGSSGRREKWGKIYKSGVLTLIIACAVLIYGYINVETTVVTEYSLSTDKAIPERNMKVVLVADLHAGTIFTQREFEDRCRQIQAQDPDMLLLAGDIFDEGTPEPLMRSVTEALGGIDTKYGSYYVFGNHDNGVTGNNRNFNDSEITKEMTENSITVLDDKVADVAEGVALAGRKDSSFDMYRGKRKSVRELKGGVDRRDYLIVMDHQPKDLEQNARQGTDILVSGHTHGGQLWPLGLIGSVFKFNEMTYGHENIGGMDCIVTSGIGVWGAPFRTERHSEIVVINIKQNK